MPKSREENLKPIRSVNEARKKGQNGGKASGVARRKKKALKEEFELLLSMPLKSVSLRENLQKIGIDADEDMTIQTAIVAAMVQQASQGNVKAFTAIRDTIEAPNREDKEREISERLELMKRAFTEHDGEEDTGDE
nr:MAG TPA: hypothetical protein [Caudoviricetes sp.]